MSEEPAKRIKLSTQPFDDLATLVPKDWHEKLETEFTKPYFSELIQFLNFLSKRRLVIYPERENIFRALTQCRWENVKVVIIGQVIAFLIHVDLISPGSIRSAGPSGRIMFQCQERYCYSAFDTKHLYGIGKRCERLEKTESRQFTGMGKPRRVVAQCVTNGDGSRTRESCGCGLGKFYG